jgi:hypothetical protein
MNAETARRTSWWVAAALALLAACVVSSIPGVAWAGSYLDRAALLLDGSKRDSDMLRARLTDKELATVVQAIADTRVRVGSRMQVPAAVGKAHPHLLLALEHAERAAQAAIEGSIKVAFEKLEASRRENEAFRALCKEMNLTLPREGTPSPRALSR